MAEQSNNNKGSSKVSLKTALVLAGILAVEAALISSIFFFFGGPRDVQAEGVVEDAAGAAEQPVEMEVLSERFQNTRTGRSYLYDTEIYIVAAQKHQPHLEGRIERMRAQIRADVATVFARAEPAHLMEPERSTLRRQIQAVLDRHMGYDDDGESMVDEVLIPNMMRFRGDM